MQLLTADILRIIALNLPVRDILNLYQTSKQYQQYICNNKPFWEALLLREVGNNTKINIPPNADINWYKEKVKIWLRVRNLILLIKEKIKAKNARYVEPYNISWDDFEIVENLLELYCSHNQLTTLPPISLKNNASQNGFLLQIYC